MQDNERLNQSLRSPLQPQFIKNRLAKIGVHGDTGAPITDAVSVGDAVMASFGDGTIRIFRADSEPKVLQVHQGAILCIASGDNCVFTGGQDGRFLKISIEGSTEELANFGSKWVDCVAAKSGAFACSSGRNSFVWSTAEREAVKLEHPSTVGGLAFDSVGKRLGVSHYGGVTVWEYKKNQWKKSKLFWQGSHGPVTFSPDGKFIITAMQENALHGWRIRGKIDLAMAGYPGKVKKFTWVGEKPHLVTSGANEAICWPFDGPKGPMNRAPMCVARYGRIVVTYVEPFLTQESVIVGFQDGTVMLVELDEIKQPIVLRDKTDAEVSAIAITKSGSHLFIGDTMGGTSWTKL